MMTAKTTINVLYTCPLLANHHRAVDLFSPVYKVVQKQTVRPISKVLAIMAAVEDWWFWVSRFNDWMIWF
jgi:hypothetical protein